MSKKLFRLIWDICPHFLLTSHPYKKTNLFGKDGYTSSELFSDSLTYTNLLFEKMLLVYLSFKNCVVRIDKGHQNPFLFGASHPIPSKAFYSNKVLPNPSDLNFLSFIPHSHTKEVT